MSLLVYPGFALILGSISLLVLGRDLRSRLPVGRSIYLVALVLVPLAALSIYLFLGSSQDLQILDRMQRLILQQAEGVAPSPEQRQDLLDAMRRRAERRDSPEYWFLVANQHMAEGRYDQAVEGFQRASELAPQDVAIKAEQAQAMFLDAGNRLTAAVQEIVTEVHTMDPGNVTINGLLGIAAYQVSEWQLAINYWQIALAGLAPMSPDAQAIQSSIEAARSMLEGDSDTSALAGPVADSEILVELSLDPSINVDPQTTVFVFARPIEGVAMPIAVKRLTVADLPTQISLSDADAMVESLMLSRFPSVDIVARISFGDSPTASSGDYEARAENLQPSSNPVVDLVIRDQLP